MESAFSAKGPAMMKAAYEAGGSVFGGGVEVALRGLGSRRNADAMTDARSGINGACGGCNARPGWGRWGGGGASQCGAPTSPRLAVAFVCI